ncbi:cytochrome c biogenesis protein ResB [Singulisphaera sp. PoT]|uniref:cytochrome c biogenesis protein ResB n=1 Tax=Singulisphaera sp. PoT TaxID=3411797 RepID=UPI003BF61B67
MATATKKNPSPAPRPSSDSPTEKRSFLRGLLKVLDAIYRFLASLKLAVICLAGLSAVLAYATFFESWYGMSAVQEWIYQTRGFALLLAFLGTNILCAALIRYPWKRRQIGFLITHAGLLILLAGSFQSLKTADEGLVSMMEGESKKELLRSSHPMFRVLPIDPSTQEPTNDEYKLPFQPGNFAWGPGSPKPLSVFGSAYSTLTGGRGKDAAEGELVSSAGDPFTLRVKSYLPSSQLVIKHVPDRAGIPMIKISPKAKPPKAVSPIDVFKDDDEAWFVPTSRMDRTTFSKFFRFGRRAGPAQFAFLYVDRPELVEDFLNPPKDAGSEGVARFHYQDNAGKNRNYDWKLQDQKSKSVSLPDSDLKITYEGNAELPIDRMGMEGVLGEATLTVANFRIQKGAGTPVMHHAWGLLPMGPNVIPREDDPNPKPLVGINYFVPPEVNPKTNGRFGLIEVMGTPDGSLYYRVFGRGDNGFGQLRNPPSRIEVGKEVLAFGGNDKLPMTLSFVVDEYLTSGREERTYEALNLPKSQLDRAVPATQVEMTVKDSDGKPTTKDFWLQRFPEGGTRRLTFPSGTYDVLYDFDHKPLGFSVKLDDFKVEFDPGTEQPSAYTSQVRLTDELAGIKDQKHTISMNVPLTHRGYTFYQASYNREKDPTTDADTGRFASVFQVATDPGRPTKYAGCILIVLGAFVQFYMRAGLFSDGGKREKARSEAKARKISPGVSGAGDTPTTDVTYVNESEDIL